MLEDEEQYRSRKSMFLRLRSYCFILLVGVFLPMQVTAQGGLKFYGSEQPINQRTSYSVFGDKSVAFSTRFDVNFKLALYPVTAFGYILRIKNNESDRIYNLFYDGQGDDHIFRFNEEGQNNLIDARINKGELPNLPWYNIKLEFNLNSDSIKLTIHNQTFGAQNEEVADSYQPIILFGKSDHIIDVPSFAIKDLSIGNHERYTFTLNEGKGNIVYDVSGKAFGEVSNPEWLINDAFHWRHKVAFKSQSVAGANYNAQRKEIYYFNRDSLSIYNVRTGSTSTKVFEEKCPVKLKLGTNFINTNTDKLYSYEPFNDDYIGPTVASLDLNSYQWTVENSTQLVSPLHHHGGYFDSDTEQYTIYGGFGRMRYGKDFYSYDVSEKKWDTLKSFSGDFLSPRYFLSLGHVQKTNTIYVFGGMGNESGEQSVGRKYYYDLHKIDLTTGQVSKLWEIEWKKDNMVPVRGMIIADDSSFYTLCYPEHVSESYLRLYKFSFKDGSHQILGDSIPIRSDKITTNANLYYDSTLNNLYAIVQEFDDDISSDLNLYSIAFPPITAKELASYTRNKSNYALGIFILFVVIVGIGYLFYRRQRTKKSAADNLQTPFEIRDATTTDLKPATRPNSIYLFGDFMVRDKKNRDITYMFSAQLKQIFNLILQYSTTEEGIASQKLSNIFWPDKPADKVKNSRGVTLNHLRKILGELDGIELIYEKGCFKIAQSEKIYCDYSRCMHIIASGEIETYRNELVEILARGKFLDLTDHALYDSFKEETEKKLEPVLLLEIEKTFDAGQYETTIVFAEAVANLDPLNDVALTFQLKAMQHLKMDDEAKIRYRSFVIEYKKIMGSDYPHPYKELV